MCGIERFRLHKLWEKWLISPYAIELDPGALNVTAISEDGLFFFVGASSKILQYVLPQHTEAVHSYFLEASVRYGTPRSSNTLHFLKSDSIQGRPVLLATFDTAEVHIYFYEETGALSNPYVASVSIPEYPDNSAWSASVHPSFPALAVGSNAHSISVIDLEVSPLSRHKLTVLNVKQSVACCKQSCILQDYSPLLPREISLLPFFCHRGSDVFKKHYILPLESRNQIDLFDSTTENNGSRVVETEENYLDDSEDSLTTVSATVGVTRLFGHQNNIPSVSFAPLPNVALLASASIDQCIRLWWYKKNRSLLVGGLIFGQWCWNLQWINISGLSCNELVPKAAIYDCCLELVLTGLKSEFISELFNLVILDETSLVSKILQHKKKYSNEISSVSPSYFEVLFRSFSHRLDQLRHLLHHLPKLCQKDKDNKEVFFSPCELLSLLHFNVQEDEVSSPSLGRFRILRPFPLKSLKSRYAMHQCATAFFKCVHHKSISRFFSPALDLAFPSFRPPRNDDTDTFDYSHPQLNAKSIELISLMLSCFISVAIPSNIFSEEYTLVGINQSKKQRSRNISYKKLDATISRLLSCLKRSGLTLWESPFDEAQKIHRLSSFQNQSKLVFGLSLYISLEWMEKKKLYRSYLGRCSLYFPPSTMRWIKKALHSEQVSGYNEHPDLSLLFMVTQNIFLRGIGILTDFQLKECSSNGCTSEYPSQLFLDDRLCKICDAIDLADQLFSLHSYVTCRLEALWHQLALQIDTLLSQVNALCLSELSVPQHDEEQKDRNHKPLKTICKGRVSSRHDFIKKKRDLQNKIATMGRVLRFLHELNVSRRLILSRCFINLLVWIDQIKENGMLRPHPLYCLWLMDAGTTKQQINIESVNALTKQQQKKVLFYVRFNAKRPLRCNVIMDQAEHSFHSRSNLWNERIDHLKYLETSDSSSSASLSPIDGSHVARRISNKKKFYHVRQNPQTTSAVFSVFHNHFKDRIYQTNLFHFALPLHTVPLFVPTETREERDAFHILANDCFLMVTTSYGLYIVGFAVKDCETSVLPLPHQPGLLIQCFCVFEIPYLPLWDFLEPRYHFLAASQHFRRVTYLAYCAHEGILIVASQHLPPIAVYKVMCSRHPKRPFLVPLTRLISPVFQPFTQTSDFHHYPSSHSSTREEKFKLEQVVKNGNEKKNNYSHYRLMEQETNQEGSQVYFNENHLTQISGLTLHCRQLDSEHHALYVTILLNDKRVLQYRLECP